MDSQEVSGTSIDLSGIIEEIEMIQENQESTAGKIDCINNNLAAIEQQLHQSTGQALNADFQKTTEDYYKFTSAFFIVLGFAVFFICGVLIARIFWGRMHG